MPNSSHIGLARFRPNPVQRARSDLQEAGVDVTGMTPGDLLRLGRPALKTSKQLGTTITPGFGQAGSLGSPLALAASLASTAPGLSRADFEARLREAIPKGGDVNALYQQYRLLSGGTAPMSADEVTSPEPEGPGRFSATRPKDLIPTSPMRFSANG